MRLLLINDDATLLKTTVYVLKGAGHMVDTAITGDDALAVYEKNGPYDAIPALMVLSWPKLSSRETRTSPSAFSGGTKSETTLR